MLNGFDNGCVNGFDNLAEDDSGSDSGGSGRSGSSRSSRSGSSGRSGSGSDGEQRMEAQESWQGQAKAWISASGVPQSLKAPALTGDSQSGLGIHKTTWQTEQTRRTHVVMLDSLDRDQTVFPTPTALRLKLPRVYKNVERIDIVQLKFLNSIFTFSKSRGNTGFTWSTSSGSHRFDVPDGTYTLAALQAQFSAAGFNLHVNPSTGRVTLDMSGTAFSIPWASDAPVSSGQTRWGMGWNLGFAKQNLAGAASYTGETWPRLFDDYAFLQLNMTEQMNDVDHTSPEQVRIWQDSTGQVQHYFGKLLLNNFGCWSQSFVEAPKMFRPPLSRLERINVNWLDCTGQPIGGGAIGCDWHMTVRIIEYVEGPTTAAALLLSSDQQ